MPLLQIKSDCNESITVYLDFVPMALIFAFRFQVFTSKMTNGPQYRPISYFVTFYLTRMVTGNSIILFNIYACLLLTVAAFQFIHVCQRMVRDWKISFFSLALFLYHPVIQAEMNMAKSIVPIYTHEF